MTGWPATLALAIGLARLIPAASAQIPLYENRLPDGDALIRFANTTGTAVALQPDFTDPVTLGAGQADRISAYRVVEQVAGRTLTLRRGGASTSFALTPNHFYTFLVTGTSETLTGTLIPDIVQYNELRAKLSFYNAAASCSTAALTLGPAGPAIFTGVKHGEMRTRSINPVEAAKVQAACGTRLTAPLDLGELNEGGLYTVWLMAPSGVASLFLAQDSIAPYQH